MYKQLSPELHQRLLGSIPAPLGRVQERMVRENLEPFGLLGVEDLTPDVELPLPDCVGDVRASVAQATIRHQKDLETLGAICQDRALVPVDPSWFPRVAGWFTWTGETWEASGPPVSSVGVLDFETYSQDQGEDLQRHWIPFCAGWLDALTGELRLWVCDFSQPVTALPVDQCPRDCLILGHNSPYDRQYLLNEYLIAGSGNRWVDTMALWIASHGMCNQQRPVYKLYQDVEEGPLWTQKTGTNGLDAVYKFYTGRKLPKGVRDEIVNQGLSWIRTHLGDCLSYCSGDLYATLTVFRHLWPETLRRVPSEVNLGAFLDMGSYWLPLSSDRWPGWFERVEKLYQDRLGVLETQATQAAQAALEAGEPEYPWLDWTPAKSGKNKGLPKWYRDFIKNPKPTTKIGHYLLQITYLGKLTYWEGDHRTGGWVTADGPVPHPEEPGKRVTSLFAKGFVSAFEKGALSAGSGLGTETVQTLTSLLNWKSLRKRVRGMHTESPEGFPVWLPQVTSWGTVTYRCADRLSQVMANPKALRLGTELKSLIEAPPYFRLVGFDVDSQELRLAALMGDQYLGVPGSTPLGLQVLVGNKATGTDPHSAVAKIQGIPRDDVKLEIYGAIYGQGYKGTYELLAKALPDKSPQEVSELANLFLTAFKGGRSYGTYARGTASQTFNKLSERVKVDQQRSIILGKALSASFDGRDFSTTRTNWEIQASGSDYRDLLLVLIRWLYNYLGVQGRVILTIHDEVRTVVAGSDVALAVWAQQTAHLLAWVVSLDAMGFDTIPLAIAYASEVDVDTVLRKSPKAGCQTPSQPDPIAPGEAWTAERLLKELRSIGYPARVGLENKDEVSYGM